MTPLSQNDSLKSCLGPDSLRLELRPEGTGWRVNVFLGPLGVATSVENSPSAAAVVGVGMAYRVARSGVAAKMLDIMDTPAVVEAYQVACTALDVFVVALLVRDVPPRQALTQVQGVGTAAWWRAMGLE
jgi:hypothetical protein